MSFFRRELALDATMADLPAILSFVETACLDAAVNPDLVFDLQLAVEEACSNVIEHAYHGQGGHLRVLFEAADNDVVITLHDQGQAFDPTRVAAPNTALPLSKRPVGGLGLHLMRTLMDEVRFAFAPDRNTLVMIKRNAIGAASSHPQEEADG